MRAAQITDSGRVSSVGPAALTTKAAAAYLGCSTSWLEQTRAADTKRAARAEPLTGPRWCLLRFGVRYLRADLDAWIAQTAVACGVQESQRRAPKVAP